MWGTSTLCSLESKLDNNVQYYKSDYLILALEKFTLVMLYT